MEYDIVGNRLCNFCSYQRLVKRALKAGLAVTIMAHEGGVDVYKHPKGIDVTAMPREERLEKYFVVWYMNLPDRCAC